MSKTKLTLSIDDNLVKFAKDHAKEENISISSLLNNLLQFLMTKDEKTLQVTKNVDELTGIISLEKDKEKEIIEDELLKKYG